MRHTLFLLRLLLLVQGSGAREPRDAGEGKEPHEYSPNNVASGQRSPRAGIEARFPVVPQHKVLIVTEVNDEVILLLVFLRYVGLFEGERVGARCRVDENLVPPNLDRLAGKSDNALDEENRGLLGEPKYDDLSTTRIAKLVGELVDDEVLAGGESGIH